ncbi:unnamed protein product, partial [Didymodactylos carnosus]
ADTTTTVTTNTGTTSTSSTSTPFTITTTTTTTTSLTTTTSATMTTTTTLVALSVFASVTVSSYWSGDGTSAQQGDSLVDRSQSTYYNLGVTVPQWIQLQFPGLYSISDMFEFCPAS